MKYVHKIFLFIVIVLAANIAQAQPGALPASEMSLQNCIDAAWKNNLQVRQAELQAQGFQNSYEQSKWSKLPILNSSIGQNFNFGRTIDPFSNAFTDQNISSNNVSLNTSILVFGGYQIQNTIKQNAQNLEASRFDIQAIKDNIALQVVLAYLQILNNEDLLAIAQSQAEVSKLQISRTEKLVAAGSLPQINILDLKAQLANDELSIVTTQNSLDATKLTLLQLMNADPNQDIKLSRISIITQESSIYQSNPQQIYAIAQYMQATIKAADLRIQSAKLGIDIAKAGLYPTVSLFGSVSTAYSSIAPKERFVGDGTGTRTIEAVTRNYITVNGSKLPLVGVTDVPNGSIQPFGYFDQLNFNLNKAIGISVRIPIFNGFAVKTRIANAEITQKNQEIVAQNTRLQLRQNIDQAYINMAGASKRFVALENQVKALQEAFRAAESRFNAGVINSVDYNIAKTNLDKARANSIQAKFDYIFRTKILDYYQNKPLSF